ncbi:MAG: hypothetical protein RXR41_06120 [Candidatus Marsarchaeota archaeon]
MKYNRIDRGEKKQSVIGPGEWVLEGWVLGFPTIVARYTVQRCGATGTGRENGGNGGDRDWRPRE